MFKKTEKKGIVLGVVSQIEEAIIERKVKVGDKLPPPHELEKTLGTSRGTLREAFRILEQKGLVETRIGFKGGTFVKESTVEPVSEGLALLIRQRKISLEDLAQFRIVVEAGLIQLVAEKAKGQDIEQLREYLKEFQEYVEQGSAAWKDFLEVEIKLRKALIRLSGSRIYEAVLVPIHDNILSYSYEYIPGEKAGMEEAYRDWSDIIDALARHDTDTAESVTQDHIRRYAKLMKNGRNGPSHIK